MRPVGTLNRQVHTWGFAAIPIVGSGEQTASGGGGGGGETVPPGFFRGTLAGIYVSAQAPTHLLTFGEDIKQPAKPQGNSSRMGGKTKRAQ